MLTAELKIVNSNNRTKKSILTALTYLAMMGSSIITSFIATPIIVAGLGTGAYGVWRVLLQAASYMNHADLGGNSALKWSMAISSTSLTEHQNRQNIGTVFFIWLFASPISLIIGLAAIYLYPNYIDIPITTNETEIRIALSLLLVSFVFFCIFHIPSSALRGLNLEYKAIHINIFTSVLPVTLGALAVVMGSGLIGMAAAHLIATLCIGLAKYKVAKRNISWFGIGKPEIGQLNRMFKLGIWFVTWSLSLRVLDFTDVIIVGLLFDAETAGRYALMQFFILALFSAVFGLMGSILPSMGNLIGLKQFETIKLVRSQSRYILWLIITVITTSTICLNENFIFVWIGSDTYMGDHLTALMIIMAAMTTLLLFETNTIDTTLKIKKKTLISVAGAITLIPTSYFLANSLGIVGVMIAFIVVRLGLTIAFYPIAESAIRSQNRNWITTNLKPAFACVIISCSFYYLTVDFEQPVTWLYVITKFGLISTLSGVIFWVIGVPVKTRRMLLERLRTIFVSRT